ncbi:MAG: NYN domain-containing protein [Scytonematopsis contorta HA4267-MV1]|jgi:hypothetical protein|nr:NYN domain-containing protein [Scytonematopsis contorta HA4267-MV1]
MPAQIIYNSDISNIICSYICETVIVIQRHYPELLVDKYRKYNWSHDELQSYLTVKLTALLNQAQDWDGLLKNLQVFLNVLLISGYTKSTIYIELIKKINKLNQTTDLSLLKVPQFTNETTPFSKSPHSQNSGITVLLLDAENLQINLETEKFLSQVCAYPLQVKVAFANWRNMGKLDVELHQRCYDLIHVPSGKNNADGKMIVFGSSLHEHYPKAKEVLVCSSDTVMTNLCNHLQKNGLTVHRVNQQGNDIKVFNSYTGQTLTHTLKNSKEITNLTKVTTPKIPTIEEFIAELKVIIKTQQQYTANHLVKLSSISQLFKTKYNFSVSQVMSYHFPGKKARDIFIDNPLEFVVQQNPDESELYVTLFESNKLKNFLSKSHITETPPSINSTQDLIQALSIIITQLTNNSPDTYIDAGILASAVNKIYGQGITKIIKKLQLGNNFIKFLKSCTSFKLKQKGTIYQVSINSVK